MRDKRVRLSAFDAGELFQLVKSSPDYCGWKKLVERVKTNSTSLKAFRRGELTLCVTVFLRLLGFLNEGRRKHFLGKAELRDKNWGQRKGGISLASKFSKEQLKERMKKVRDNIRPARNEAYNSPPLENLDLCEFLGAMYGDGCTGKYLAKEKKSRLIYPTQIVGNASKDEEYIKRIGLIIKENFKVKPYLRVIAMDINN